jgi:hypothetical protein
MAPRGGLRFARDEAVFAIGPDGMGSRESQMLDLTDSQRFATGVIQARSPTNLEFIGFRPARERLSFARESVGMTVVNGLGATIRVLIYRESDTVYHHAGPLSAGHKATLRSGAPSGGIRPRPGDVVPSDLPLSSRFEYLFEHQPAGSYLAILDRSPFWNPGVTAVDERGSFHVVWGWVGGQP